MYALWQTRTIPISKFFTSGGGIVDVQGRALQGLKVNIISSNKTIYAIIKFENSKWTSTIYEG